MRQLSEYVERSDRKRACLPDGVKELIRVREPIIEEPSDDWEELESPARLRKRYRLGDRGKVLPFLEMLMEHEDAVAHHARITVENTDVTIEVGTHELDAVTERDHGYAAQADAIAIDLDIGYADYVRDQPDIHTYEVMAADFRDLTGVGYNDDPFAYEP